MNGAASPPASGPRASTVPTVAGHIEVAKLAQLGRAVLTATGKADPAAALAEVHSLVAGKASAPAAPRPAVVASRPAPPAAPRPASTALSPRDVRRALAAGVDPDELAAVLQQQQRRRA